MQERLTALEKKMAFQEHLLQELNGVVLGQQKEIDRLMARLKAMQDLQEQGDLVRDRVEEERPPHY